MAYATKADLDQRFGVQNVISWSNVDPATTAADTARITAAINRAAEDIDNRFQGTRYSVPLVGKSSTLLCVKDWNVVLAGYWLFQARGMGIPANDPVTGNLAKMVEDVDAEIRMYKAGQRVLPAIECAYYKGPMAPTIAGARTGAPTGLNSPFLENK